MMWTKVGQLGQVMQRQVAAKVGENVVQQAAKLWRRKTSLRRPHRRAPRSISVPSVAHQREGKRFSVKLTPGGAAEYFLVHTLRKGGYPRVTPAAMREHRRWWR